MNMADRVLGEKQSDELYQPGTRAGRSSQMSQSWQPCSAREKSELHTMGMTSIEKILANHSDQAWSNPGTSWSSMSTPPSASTSCGPTSSSIADPDKVVLLHDHMVPAPTVQSANMAKEMRAFVEKFGVKNYFPLASTVFRMCWLPRRVWHCRARS